MPARKTEGILIILITRGNYSSAVIVPLPWFAAAPCCSCGESRRAQTPPPPSTAARLRKTKKQKGGLYSLVRCSRSWSDFTQCVTHIYAQCLLCQGHLASAEVEMLFCRTLVEPIAHFNSLLSFSGLQTACPFWPLTSTRHHNCPLMGLFSFYGPFHTTLHQIVVRHSGGVRFNPFEKCSSLVKPHASGRLLGLFL